jgi:hypothetical protein
LSPEFSQLLQRLIKPLLETLLVDGQPLVPQYSLHTQHLLSYPEMRVFPSG